LALDDELSAVVAAAGAFRSKGEDLIGVVAAEGIGGRRLYLCAYSVDGRHTWVALDGEARPLEDLAAVRDAVSMIGLCELAEEFAGGGDVPELRARLADLRRDEHPAGIEAAEQAAAELDRTLERDPRIASAGYLDAIGAAATALEKALGTTGTSPFAEAMRGGAGVVDGLVADVEANYKLPLG